MISEHDRTRMREEAERVMAAHPNTFTDPHLMAVFVVTLLDHSEAAIDVPETRSVPPVGGGWSPWFFWHHVGRYLRSRGWEFDRPKLGWYEPRHGMDVRFPVAEALSQQLKRDFDTTGSVDDFAAIARRPPWRDEDPKPTRKYPSEEEAARIADEAVREVRKEMAAERSEGPLLPAPTPEEVRAWRDARRRREAWGESYGGSDPDEDERGTR